MSKHLRIEIPAVEKQTYSPKLKEKSRVTPKKKNKIRSEQYVQDWLPFDSIVHGMIKLKDKRYIKVLEIEAQNFELQKNKDRNEVIRIFQKWTTISPLSFQIKIITEKTDITTLMEELNQRTREEMDDRVQEAKADYVRLVKMLSSHESSKRRFFIIIEYEGNMYNNYKKSYDEEQISEDMNTVCSSIASSFSQMGNPIVQHESESAFLEEFLYRYLCKRSSAEETIRGRKNRIVRDYHLIQSIEYPDDLELQSRIPKVPLNTIIAPRGINFEPFSYCVVDGVCYTFLFIKNDSYPQYVYANWTECLNFGEGVDVDFFFNKLDRERTNTELGQVIARRKAAYVDKRENDRLNEEDTINAGLFIQNRLRAGEDLYYGITMITIWDENLDEMRQKRGRVIASLKTNQIKVLPALGECEEAFKLSLPVLYMNSHLQNKFQRNFLSSSFASTYPFNELRLVDEHGFVLGLCGDSLAIFNPFDTHKHNNANIGIFGPSGSGKTYLNLTLARRFRLSDIGVLMILPIKGHEYIEAIKALNGVFINLSPGSEVCLNIMEIRAEAEIDAAILSEAEVTARSKLQNQISQVITFIQLLLGDEKMTSTQESELETIIAALYYDFGITHDNMSLYDENGKIKKMPIIEDLYNRCLDNPRLESVVAVLNPFVISTGTCRNMNGQTNIDLSNKVIAFDVSYCSDRYLPAFMYTAIVFCYSKIKENVYDKYELFLDEGWKFILNEMAEKFVNELIKILRGYAGGVVYSTQNLTDATKGRFGASIIDNCACKFLLKVGENEYDLFQKLFRLTDQETKKIANQQKGHITLLTNREEFPIVTKTSRTEHLLYTTDPNERMRMREVMMNNG